MNGFKPPYLGAAYYPEAWPAALVEEDARLMRALGLNAARVGEFAWSALEPEEGRFELDWLRRAVDTLGENGIAVILCTPSCTPPAWLTAKYPETLIVDHAGARVSHGARRHACPNNAVYREFCGRIAEALAVAFGNDARVIGWQIDNEVYPWDDWGCYCGACAHLFRASLEREFGTVAALNAAWGTRVWSQTYDSFPQVPLPAPGHWHHPSLVAAWHRFQGRSLVDYVAHQAEVLHRHARQPVGTDMMPVLGVPYESMHRTLDVVQYNHYDTTDNLWRQVFWMRYARSFKDRPFWNTETSTCWNGGTAANGYREPGFCRANSWLPIALGAEVNLYWLWRTHWSGQELMHGAVVSTCGRPLHIAGEVREVGEGFRAAADFINGTRPVRAELAVHLSTQAWGLFRTQPVANGFDYVDAMIHRVYRPLMDAGLQADVIDPAATLDGYKVVVSPFLAALDESGLCARLRMWIEGGGTWIAGPFTDIRTPHGTKFTHAPFGVLEDWAQVTCPCELPGDPRRFAIKRVGAAGDLTGSLWYCGLEIHGAARATAVYTEGPLAGLAAVTETPVGKGRIVLLGTLPEPDDLRQLAVEYAAQQHVIPVAEASPTVLVVPREGAAGSGAILVELGNRPARVKWRARARNILTGKVHDKEIALGRYEVMVLANEPAAAAVTARSTEKDTAMRGR